MIETLTNTDDDRGGVTRAWSTHATVWASVMPISAREAYQHGQLQGSVTHRVMTRYQSGVAMSMRVKWGSRIFQIIGVRNVGEESRWLELDCVEERPVSA